jgi:hypothetical protein
MNNFPKDEFKKGIINYVDLVFSVAHFFIIVFPLIIIQQNLLLEVTGITFCSFLLFFVVYYFTLGNPFYISYGIALLLCNFFFLIPSVLLHPLIGVFLIPEMIYIYIISFKNRTFSAGKAYGDARYRAKVGSVGLPPNPDPNLKLREGKQSEKTEKRYNAKKHSIISFILMVLLLIVFFSWFDISLI